MGHKNRNRVLFILFCACVAAFFLAVNLNNPITGEDYSLAYLLHGDYPSKSLDGKLHAVIDAIKGHSLTWNARLGEQLAIVFLGMDPHVYAFVNTFMALSFFYLAFYFAFGRPPDPGSILDLLVLGMLFSAVILFMPVIGEVFFLRNTATNYLWACDLILVFSIPYRLMASGRDVFGQRHHLIPLYACLGFLVGMTNENTGIMFFAAALIQAFFIFRDKKNPPAWFYIGIAALAFGASYLLLSPSTGIRIKYYSNLYHSGGGDITGILKRLLQVAADFLRSGWGIAVLSLLCGLYYAWVRREEVAAFVRTLRTRDGDFYDAVMLFSVLCIALVSVLVLALPPYHETRSFVFAYTFMLIFSCRAMAAIMAAKGGTARGFAAAIITAMLILSAGYSWDIFTKYVYFNSEWAARDAEIRTLAASGVKQITVRPFKTRTQRCLNTREEYLFNTAIYQYAGYYGVKRIYCSVK